MLMEETKFEGSRKRSSDIAVNSNPVMKRIKPSPPKEDLNGQLKPNVILNGLSKKVKKLSRGKLEEIFTEHIIRGLHNEHELAELRRKEETSQSKLEFNRQQIDSLKKQLSSLSSIIKKYITDQTSLGPKTGLQKITRSVGLQVVRSPGTSFNGIQRGRGGRVLLSRPGVGTVRTPGPNAVQHFPPADPVRPVNPPIVNTNTSPRLAKPIQPPTNMISRPLTCSRVNQVSTSPKPSDKPQPEIVELDLSDDDSPAPLLNRSPKTLTRPVVRTLHNTGLIARNRQIHLNGHPAPLPNSPRIMMIPGLKNMPPQPSLNIKKGKEGVVLRWDMDLNVLDHEPVSSYQLFAYQVRLFILI